MAEWDGVERRTDETHVIRAECIKRTAEALAEGHELAQSLERKILEMRDERKQQIDGVLDCVDALSTRVKVLEEQVGGDMGIIKTMQLMQGTLQQMRDSLNKQAWLVPLATAAITTGVVALVTKMMQ